MGYKMQKVCIVMQTLLLLLGGAAYAKKGIYDKMQDQQDKINEQVNDFIWDKRPNTTFEKVLQFIFYLPLSFAWFAFTGVSAVLLTYKLINWIVRTKNPTEDEIKVVDHHSLNMIKLVTLNKLNNERGENKLSFGVFMQCYLFLNFRTDFEADDVFSQKTAILSYIHRIKTNANKGSVEEGDGYLADGAINKDEEDEEFLQKLDQQAKVKVQKALRFRTMLYMMCILSLVTSSLALGLIMNELVIKQTRKIVLSSFGNAILRICFGMVVLFIAQRDIMQIIVNLSVRLTGAVSEPQTSRFIFTEAILRISLTCLALITILFVVFSTPRDEYEGIIDQTMNFTALVILLEIDNILASVFQQKIDNLKIDFELNPDTLEFEFNRCADFLQGRRNYFCCQYWLELLFLYGFATILFLVILILPIFNLMLYVIIPPHAVIEKH